MSQHESDLPNLAGELASQLSDDPVEATAQIMTTAAFVAIRAGFDDAAAVRGLHEALDQLRAHGVGEVYN